VCECICSLSVRGLKTDSAVLCTNDESFELKEAETSNSLLLLPHCQFTAETLSHSSTVNRQVGQTLSERSLTLTHQQTARSDTQWEISTAMSFLSFSSSSVLTSRASADNDLPSLL